MLQLFPEMYQRRLKESLLSEMHEKKSRTLQGGQGKSRYKLLACLLISKHK